MVYFRFMSRITNLTTSSMTAVEMSSGCCGRLYGGSLMNPLFFRESYCFALDMKTVPC